MITERALKYIEDCERGLREIAAEALNLGEYDSAMVIMEWAKTISGVTANRKNKIEPSQEKSENRESKSADSDNSNDSEDNSETDSPAPKKRRKYPQFARQQNELIKFGWSKRARKEYQHRSPRTVLELLVGRIAEFGARRKLFTADMILPLKDSAGNEIPSYQAYLCLAWLRECRLVVAKGRQGYRVPSIEALKGSTGERWDKLPEQ